LSSYPDRIYNFVGNSNNEFASLTITTFEDNLLNATIKVLSNDNFNVELFVKIISNYSIEVYLFFILLKINIFKFFDRFLFRVIPEESFHRQLLRILTFDKVEKRKRENILIRVIQFVSNGKILKV
jgi:hypothetical protein